MGMNDFNLPDLPNAPTDNDPPSNPAGENDDIDFDDLMKRFENLKKRK